MVSPTPLFRRMLLNIAEALAKDDGSGVDEEDVVTVAAYFNSYI